MPPNVGPEIAAALLRHFDSERRSMPWRETSDPYAIWVSEVMLQQTRVDTVIPYWERWLERFPTVETLAEAELDDVLKEWEGLGYYSRARNLHGAARMVRERFDGDVPSDPDTLRELPGVGPYTAGAIASIAYGVPTPAVDGNVRRVLARLYDLEAPTAAELRTLAAALVPDDRPGDFNQALMELGATICTPRSPDCDACPLAEWCEARRLGVQELRPLPRAKKPIPEETVRTAVIVRGDGALLLARRPEDGLLGGLWEFPGAEAGEADDDGPDGIAEAGWARDRWPPGVERLIEANGWPAGVASLIQASEPVAALDPVVHTFSHKRVTYEPFLGRAPVAAAERVAHIVATGETPEPGPPAAERLAWVAPARLDAYALPVAQRKIAKAAVARLSG